MLNDGLGLILTDCRGAGDTFDIQNTIPDKLIPDAFEKRCNQLWRISLSCVCATSDEKV